jgi:hypothetical protein
MKLTDKAFPQKLGDVTQYQWIESGLTKLEYFALHLMSASVNANDHSIPQNMDGLTVKYHAKSAIMLARALAEELEAESGR